MTRFFLQTFFGLFVASVLASAQPFGGGLKIGVPVTDALNVTASGAGYVESTNRYIVGPYVEVRLPGRFSVEFDALYRSFDFSSRSTSTSVGLWEFPLLAKYKLLPGPIKPYVEGGLVLSHLTGVKDVVELNHTSNYGITLGAGVEIHALVLRISPEVRYEGFAFQNFSSPGDFLHSNRNQALIMVGIGF
jgi:opacity protein-like surface antigen